MFVIRAATVQDAEQIYEVATHLDTVNLPADRARIATLIERSLASFAETVPTEQREFVFVLHDQKAGRVVGTSMIHAQHGTKKSPHVYFQVLKDERYSQTIDGYFVHECLRIAYDYHGPTEIGGLILLPTYRGQRLGKLLSLVRFMFIAIHRHVFRDQVLSELLPPLEDNGSSVLWQHLGRRFTGLSYQEADQLSSTNKEFIRALFPHSLIYTSLFPKHVREVVGKVGKGTLGVEAMLRGIGFRYANQIDPFDGGPHFIANTDDITIVKQTRRATVATPASQAPIASAQRAILASSTGDPHSFVATMGDVEICGATVTVGTAEQDALGVSPGDSIWMVGL